MAAVVGRGDECVGSVDPESPRPSAAPAEQPHQNNPLLGLPIVAIETILNFLSYDEISLLRAVRTRAVERFFRTFLRSAPVLGGVNGLVSCRLERVVYRDR